MNQQDFVHVQTLLRDAEAVVIAASNGFDIADGYNQFSCDASFRQVFGEFYHNFGLMSILQGLMARWPGAEDRWAFLTRLIAYGYRDYEASPVMRALDALTREVPRFVVTCNCNSRFIRAGFSSHGILETEGSYVRLRCMAGCTNETYDALGYLDEREPPRCPHCGAPLDVAVDDTGKVLALEPFRSQLDRQRAFLAEHQSARTVVLELGVGQANRAIKRPLMAWAEQAPQACYVVLNRDEPILPSLPAERVAAVRGNLSEVLESLAGGQGGAHG